MSTIRRVAKKAGVSIATVSRVVNGSKAVAPELRDRVLEAVNRVGYAPNVGRRATASIALVYTGPFSVGSPFDAACLEGIVNAMLESDFDLKITHLRRDKKSDETYSQFFYRKGIRGAILRSTAADRDIAKAIGDECFPAVVVGDRFDHPRLAFAYNESQSASVEGIEHLVSLGHKRVAFAANDTDDADHIDRLLGYRETLQRHGLYDPQLEYRVPAQRLNGAQLMRRILSLSRPATAVFIADPMTACGAINEAHKLGLRIPEEMSILGFDDTDTRFSVMPTMTAVCQDSRELGRMAYDLLLRRCHQGEDSQNLLARGKAWLELNHTTARVPQKAARIMPNGERVGVVD